MESVVFKAFEGLFKLIGFLIVSGIFACALTDLQKKAFDNKRIGLTSLLKVNQQLVGNTH